MTTLNYFKNEPNTQNVAAGQVIFNVGDVQDVMYAIKEGQIDVIVGDKVTETIGPGSIFGEMALIDDSPRSATCVAKTDAVIVPINQNRFIYMVQETPYFALQVMGIMAERLRRANSSPVSNQ